MLSVYTKTKKTLNAYIKIKETLNAYTKKFAKIEKNVRNLYL